MDNPYRPPSPWPLAATSAVRAIFGLIWAIDATLTWQAAFAAHYVGYLQNAAHGQPGWLDPWFAFWIALVTPAATTFVWITRLCETLIALGLLLGFMRKWLYMLGSIFSLLIWATAEGFSGPYTIGASNLGPALIYALMFVVLMLFDILQGPTPYSIDFYLERRYPAWRHIAELQHRSARPARLHGGGAVSSACYTTDNIALPHDRRRQRRALLHSIAVLPSYVQRS